MDIELHYIKKGAGAPLLLLHGNGESGDYFVHQVDEFARYFAVYAVDTRGHGQSPRGTAPFTISQFADDLLGFMNGQGIEKAHILGFSDGGNIALTFALAHPERVRRLLMHKREIRKLHALVKQDGYTLVPLSVYFKDSRVKVEVGLCKGKKNYDKRSAAAQRDAKREIDRAMKAR